MLSIILHWVIRGKICVQWQWQCKILASGVNFSIFTHVFVLLSPKLLKFGEIKGVRFWPENPAV